MESIEVYALRLDEEAAAQVEGYLAYLSPERREAIIVRRACGRER